MAKIDFEKSLNCEQIAAATAEDGIILVLAAAGTGKTRTLVYRVAYLVEKGIEPERILLLTFTNRAAREMLERAQVLVGAGIGGIWGGTFHHMSNRILRRHASSIGYRSDYTILDREDSRKLVSDCVESLGLKSKEFPKPEVLMSFFCTSANTETPLEKVVEERISEYLADIEDVVRVGERYQERKKKLDAMDFDDLLVNCLKLLRENENVLKKYQDHFQHVLVDEYQDANAIQAEIVDRIAEKNRNLLVVGDDFQSIYSWRGADFRNIMSFPERYPETRVYKLETNYRSVPEILEVANTCIANNPEQFQKTLRPTRESHRKPIVAKMRDGEAQARFVVDYIRGVKRNGCRLSEIAVLYRAHFHAMEFQLLLSRERIPYVITSGVRFFEQAHIKDVCSVLRILENPEDEISFQRLICMLPGVGPKTAVRVWSEMAGRFDAGDNKQLQKMRKILPHQASAVWGDIEPVLCGYSREDTKKSGGDLIIGFVKSFYERYAANTFEEFDRRLDDINEMVLYIETFESIEQFLSDVALLTNLDAEVENLKKVDQDAVRLSTVHQAKGLEWPVVIILWATDGMFPSGRSIKESADGEAEERRLFYVAVTRAKDDLLFCVPEIKRSYDGGVMYCPPSRFINEIPGKLVDEVNAGMFC